MKKEKVYNPDKVSFGKMLAWQTRPISLGCATIIIGYLSRYCTNALGMPAALVGTLILASKIFDGVTDLVAGWLIDNTNTKLGKGRPYELSIIGVWVCMYALYAANVEWPIAVKSVWVVVMYTLIWSVFSTLLNAAETPYIIRAFKTPLAITKVSAYGGLIITLGCMIASVGFPIAIADAVDADGWRKAVLMFTVPLLALGMLRFIFVKEDTTTEDSGSEEKVNLKDIFTCLKSNKYAWLLAIASMIPQMITAMSVGSYYFSVVVGDLAKLSSLSMITLVAMLFMAAFPALMKKYSAMQIVGGAAALGLIGYMVNFFAGSNMVLLVIGALLGGISALPTSYMRSPIVMQIAEYNKSKGLPSMEATVSSVVNFLCKIGQGLGSFLLGVMLSAAGYEGTLASQPASAVMMIRILYSIVPAILMVAIIWSALAFRPLDKMIEQKAEN